MTDTTSKPDNKSAADQKAAADQKGQTPGEKAAREAMKAGQHLEPGIATDAPAAPGSVSLNSLSKGAIGENDHRYDPSIDHPERPLHVSTTENVKLVRMTHTFPTDGIGSLEVHPDAVAEHKARGWAELPDPDDPDGSKKAAKVKAEDFKRHDQALKELNARTSQPEAVSFPDAHQAVAVLKALVTDGEKAKAEAKAKDDAEKAARK